MQDIKTKDHDRKPKVKNPASRMPKELIRTAAFETKAKSSRAANGAASKDSQESPTEYAENKVTSAEEWAAGKTVDTAALAGRRLAKKSYEKIRERRRGAAAEEAAREAAETTEAAEETVQRAEEAVKDSLPTAGTERDTAGSAASHGKTGRDQTAVQGRIKVRPESKESIRTSPRRTVKAPERIKSPILPGEKVKTGQVAARQKQTLHSLWRARRSAVKAAEAGNTAGTAGKSIKTTAKGLKTAVKGAVTSVKALGTLLASAGGFVLVFIVNLTPQNRVWIA